MEPALRSFMHVTVGLCARLIIVDVGYLGTLGQLCNVHVRPFMHVRLLCN